MKLYPHLTAHHRDAPLPARHRRPPYLDHERLAEAESDDLAAAALLRQGAGIAARMRHMPQAAWLEAGAFQRALRAGKVVLQGVTLCVLVIAAPMLLGAAHAGASDFSGPLPSPAPVVAPSPIVQRPLPLTLTLASAEIKT